MSQARGRLKIGVIGSGISGLSAAWLLAERHDVTLFEKRSRLGGHSNTVDVETPQGSIPVDTGFIVYNTVNYPNLTALFQHLDVGTKSSNMSFAVSLGGGAFEYAGNNGASLFAQRRNLFRPRFWSMLRGILRFYRQAPRDLGGDLDPEMTLGDYLRSRSFGRAFERDHLLPMAAAIWSAKPAALLDYPAASFIRFFDNHGLLRLRDRPAWRTVTGGSRAYVRKLAARLAGRIRLGTAAIRVHRTASGVAVRDATGALTPFDHVVIGAHADEALAMLASPTQAERSLLGAFRYTANDAVLHSDRALMPKRRAVWASWNYLGAPSDAGDTLAVTYWMNVLQGIASGPDLFLTLNPPRGPAEASVHHRETYAHPIFDGAALRAQRELHRLQGSGNIWFCGAYFGAGFHEDGLVSGLAVAEALGGVVRPWADRAPRLSAPKLRAALDRETVETVP